ncbi:MAG: nitrile hydratase accessory protein [Rubellimicrobium sp.]|nr:nitrile hydratase accessory protein [Rubellimicrobium sp.]
MTDAPGQFDDPWQAQVFALTVALSEAGHFSWPDWTAAFGATLKRHGADRELDGGEDYFNAWLETLEVLLDRTGLAERGAVLALKDAWAAAYLSTPHGQPVRLHD